MARPSKYDTEVKGKLELVTGWARDGLTNEQIAHNLGINTSTLYEYQKKHKEFSKSLKTGKEISDYQVEGSLFKRAMGYEYTEVTKERRMKGKTAEQMEEPDEFEMVTIKEVTKFIVADPTSMIFWLKNRKPHQWRDRRETAIEVETSVNLMDILKEKLIGKQNV